MEIQLKKLEKFSTLFLIMGTFHIFLMFLGVIGTRFKDAGYDRHNYARYLTFHYIEVINLEENHQSIYQ